jgi:hypothetical protein
LVDVAKSVEIVDDTIALLEEIYAFHSSSTLRHGIFSKIQKDYENVLKVPNIAIQDELLNTKVFIFF